MSSSSNSSNSSNSNPANAGAMADDAFIDVLVPGPAVAATPSSSVVVLHDFSSCATKFSGLIQGGGLVYSVTTSVPTLTMSTPNTVLGASMQDFVATQLFLVPKLHASNRLTQVSASDLEIVIEHSPAATTTTTTSTTTKRVFLCAVVSADPSVPDPGGGGGKTATTAAAAAAATTGGDAASTKLIGQDAALLAFLRNIDTSGGAAAAPMRANNAKLLPLDTHLTFPGVGTCMSYPDRKGNTVLLLGDPLLAGPELVARLFAVVAAAAPVFGNFDLAQKDGALPTLVAFRSNTAATVPSVSLLSGTGDAAAEPAENAAAAAEEDDNDAEGFEQQRRRRSSSKTKKTGDTVWMMVTAMIIVAALLVPVWVYGPHAYVIAVVRTAGANPTSVSPSPVDINVGIGWVKLLLALLTAAAVSIFATGLSAAPGNGGVVVAATGATLLLAIAVLLASVQYDLGVRTTSVVRGLPGVRQDILGEWLRWNYTN